MLGRKSQHAWFLACWCNIWASFIGAELKSSSCCGAPMPAECSAKLVPMPFVLPRCVAAFNLLCSHRLDPPLLCRTWIIASAGQLVG
jgi:hypothetical protein